MVKGLNIRTILPYLIEEGLLTNQERDILLSDSRTDNEKINNLMTWLPRKGSDSLERFTKCLKKSSEGTSHAKIADIIMNAKPIFPIKSK